jgi:outer membrane protein OmpA-like peptidoglycan-associated protein
MIARKFSASTIRAYANGFAALAASLVCAVAALRALAQQQAAPNVAAATYGYGHIMWGWHHPFMVVGPIFVVLAIIGIVAIFWEAAMKGKGIVSSKLALLMAVAAAIFAPGGQARADQGELAILGHLNCTKTGPGVTYVLFSKIPVDCMYEGAGGPQRYTGSSGILVGVDLEIERQAEMNYIVFGRGTVSPGDLAGNYVGGKASVTLGAGPAIQGGLGGVGNGFELVPFGLGGQIGGGLTGGIGYLQISFVPPAAAAAPAPAPPPPPPPAAAPVVHNFIVFFDWDKATLTEAARSVVAGAAAAAKQDLPARIQVNGYTDTSGTREYNLGLSRRRAEAIRAELIADGIAESRISTMGYGEEHLRVETAPGVREPQNRRVEILIGQ